MLRLAWGGVGVSVWGKCGVEFGEVGGSGLGGSEGWRINRWY